MTSRRIRQAGFLIVVLAATSVVRLEKVYGQTPELVPAPKAPKAPPQAPPPLPAVPALAKDAREVQGELRGIFQQYPPSLQQILQLDPSLLNNTNYLATYPVLASYLSQHPEVAHNPSFFVGTRIVENYRPTAGESIERIMEPVMVGSVFIVLICILGWIVQSIMNHRRWLRVSKLQTDMQNKLLERFTSNEEMLSFIQTSAGQRFLEAASVSAESGPRPLSAPVGRMLWSIQLGIVILVAGAGLEIVSYQLSSYRDVVMSFRVAGGVVIALGIGFILSALGAYLLSRRLGLLESSPVPSTK